MKKQQKKLIIKVQLVVGLIAIALLSIAIMVSSVLANPAEAAAAQETNLTDAGVNALTGLAQDTNLTDSNEWKGNALTGLAFGAAIAMGLAGLGAALALGTASSAAIGAIAERPEVFGRTIIFIAFIEGIGVFGFVIAFMLYLAIGQIIAL